MKVLIVSKYFYPVIGGVEIHMRNLGKALIKKGHQVQIFASNTDMKGNILPKTDTIDGIRIKRFSNVFSLMKAILTNDYDVIHYHTIRKVFVDCGIIAGKLKRKPLVFTPHCVYPSQSLYYTLAKTVYDVTVGIMSLNLVDTIISLTENDKKDIIKMGADLNKIVIIPNCIEFKKFEHVVSADLFRNKYDINRFVLYVGRIDWNKGLKYAIEAMPYLRELDLSLVIIGEDIGYKAKLDVLVTTLGVENDVLFTGKVSDDIVLSAYAACTLFILPAFYEGLPTVVLEAMAYKKPVIVTRTGGTQYVITHGYNGFLIEYSNPTDICEKVKEALQSDLKEIGENARVTVKENYTWEAVGKEVEQIYINLLKNKKFL